MKRVVNLCKNCVFETEPLSCFVGRIELLKASPDAEVVEKDGHYEVWDKMCDWSLPRQPVQSLEKLALDMRERRILKIPFVVIARESATLEDIAKTIRSLQGQQVKPHLIHIINYSAVEPRTILKLREESTIPMTVQHVILDDYPERFVYEKAKQFDQTYYAIMEAGTVIPHDFIRRVDQSYNDSMNHFVYLEWMGVRLHSLLLSDELGADFIETNDGYLYKDKVSAFCKRNNKEHLVQDWN